MTDPTSRQRGLPTETRKQLSDRNLQTGNNVLSQAHSGLGTKTLTDWPSVVTLLCCWNELENIRDLNLTVVRHMTLQVIKLMLRPDLPLTGHGLLYRIWIKRGLMCIVHK
jgi:hypothetical protein